MTNSCENPMHVSTEHLIEVYAHYKGAEPSDTIPEVMLCELERNHPTDVYHISRIQAFGNNEAWMLWDDNNYDIVYLTNNDFCNKTKVKKNDVCECDLPIDHFGKHSFELKYYRAYGRVPSLDTQIRISNHIKRHGRS